MSSPIGRVGVGVAMVLAVTAGCGDDADTGSSADEGDVIPTVIADAGGGCAYSGEGVETGTADLAVVNESEKDLFVITLRLDEGRTIDEFLAEPAELELPDYVTASAGTFEAVPPGTEATDTLAFIEPGDYVIACATARPPVELPTVADDVMVVSESG